MDIPGGIFWIFVLFGLFSRGPAMIYIFFVAQAFGTMAVIPPALLGGISITPGWTASAALTLKTLLSQPRLSEALEPLTDLRKIGPLTVCAVYGLFSAFFCPRLFAGVPVYPMRLAVAPFPLGPSSANITQPAYFCLTVLAVLTFYLLAKEIQSRRHLLNAILFGGGVVVFTGFADLLAPRGTLEPLRTATYSLLLTDGDVGAGRRVIGLMSEASSYAGLCMAFAAPIYFLRGAYKTNLTRAVIAPAVFVLLLIMIAISTSSGGYVGLAILMICISAYGIILGLRGRSVGRESVAFIYMAIAGFLGIVALNPDALTQPINLINRMVFQKNLSSSYMERGQWNQVSLQAFFDTFGLGGGLGSVRASSWPVAILGNIGIVGALSIAAFFVVVGLSRPTSGGGFDKDTVTGAKFALIPMLAIGSLSATSVDFGLMVSCLCGLVGAMSWRGGRATPSNVQPGPRRPNYRLAYRPRVTA